MIKDSKEKSYICDVEDIRIDLWLSEKLPEYSRSFVQKLVKEEMVQVNGKTVKSNYKIKTGDKIVIKIPEPKKLEIVGEDIELDVLYEDSSIIVVNKPKGMVVHPAVGNYSGTLVNALISHCKDSLSDINGVIRPGIVHRIDKDTSGILVVAKNNVSHERLSKMLKAHDIKRVYVAVVKGIISGEKGRIEAPIGRHPVDRKKMAVNVKNGRDAITHFRVLERFANETFVELKLETGRTHQIRVHMSYIGHPIIGDEVYGRKSEEFEIKGQALHAKTLGFIHPETKEYMEFTAEAPEYFKELISNLRNGKMS